MKKSGHDLRECSEGSFKVRSARPPGLDGGDNFASDNTYGAVTSGFLLLIGSDIVITGNREHVRAG